MDGIVQSPCIQLMFSNHVYVYMHHYTWDIACTSMLLNLIIYVIKSVLKTKSYLYLIKFDS